MIENCSIHKLLRKGNYDEEPIMVQGKNKFTEDKATEVAEQLRILCENSTFVIFIDTSVEPTQKPSPDTKTKTAKPGSGSYKPDPDFVPSGRTFNVKTIVEETGLKPSKVRQILRSNRTSIPQPLKPRGWEFDSAHREPVMKIFIQHLK